MSSRLVRRLASAATAAGLALGLGAAPATAAPDATSTPGGMCAPVSVPVSMTASEAPSQQVAGTLCRPSGPATTVQVLVPGGTYGRTYWSTRGNAAAPSYVETMTAAGHATLAIDRLGVGASSVPPSGSFRPDTQETVLRQVLAAARTGLGGTPFARVVAVGHSSGSTVARAVAIRHPSAVDGLVLTGESSRPVEQPWDTLLVPAPSDPAFAGRRLDAGYYSIRADRRASLFYHLEGADPAVVAADVEDRQPDVFDADFPLPDQNRAIRVPVLVVLGQQDVFNCGGTTGSDCRSGAALAAQEKPFYPRADLGAVVVGDTGHSLALHRNAPAWQAVARSWLVRRFA